MKKILPMVFVMNGSFYLCTYLFLSSLFSQLEGMNEIALKHPKKLEWTTISQQSHPNAVAYFESLRSKYPKALQDVEIDVSSVLSPTAYLCSIVFPSAWIEDLEKRNIKTQLVTEWVILHEAGHLHYQHVAKTLLTKLFFFATATRLCVVSKKDPADEFTYAQMFYAFVGMYGVSKLGEGIYSRYLMEPQADDFANKLCDNPRAFVETAKWLDEAAKKGFNSMTHPPYHSRIAKMKQAAQAKFGTSS